MNIRILVTGGTFDKEYDMIEGKLYFNETHVPEMLKLGRCDLDIDVRTLMMIDSLDMTDADRLLISHQAQACDECNLVITHGTDTMSVTAEFLAIQKIPKTNVLTGALIPYKFGSSDGFFNLGSALAFAQVLPQGVYISMNGRYFTAGRVRKNRDTGMFEEVAGTLR
jgi:L-asparaginase